MAVTVFDTEKLIGQIKKHPAIYDVNCLQYVDRAAKTNAWFEVCRAMIPDWNSLTEEERAIEDKCLRNKWRNIRDYFMKEVKAQKKPGSRGDRKRKKSTYYDHLLFLIPSVKKRGGRGKNSRLQRSKNELLLRDDIEIVATPQVEEYNLPSGPALHCREPTEQDSSSYRHNRQTVAACETSITAYENEISMDAVNGGGVAANGTTGQTNRRSLPPDDDDYDRMFLLSLLPSLRHIPEHMKLHVRIQIQQILASAFHATITS